MTFIIIGLLQRFFNIYLQAFVSKSIMDELKRIIEESEVCNKAIASKIKLPF